MIVTGFTTDPAEVRAGSNFKLTIHLKNTSRMKVSNMLFDLSAPTEGSDEQTTSPAFLPSSGASSIYLDSIAPNGTADISIELNAKSDLLQKPYSNLICTVIIVTVSWEVSLNLEVCCKTIFVTDNFNLSVFDSAQGVNYM